MVQLRAVTQLAVQTQSPRRMTTNEIVNTNAKVFAPAAAMSSGISMIKLLPSFLLQPRRRARYKSDPSDEAKHLSRVGRDLHCGHALFFAASPERVCPCDSPTALYSLRDFPIETPANPLKQSPIVQPQHRLARFAINRHPAALRARVHRYFNFPHLSPLT
jgi:hypothetical protein